MQYDMERFDQPLVDETQPKVHVWTDIGEAEVEHSIFGKAKVRVYRKRDEIRGALRWTLLSMSLVVGAVWLVSDAARQPEIVYVAPPKPVVEVAKPEPQAPVRVAPQIKHPVTSPIVMKKPVPQLQASSAPVEVRPLPRAPVAASGVAATAVVAPAPVAPKPTAVAVNPLAPATPVTAEPVAAMPGVPRTPAVVSSAVPATD